MPQGWFFITNELAINDGRLAVPSRLLVSDEGLLASALEDGAFKEYLRIVRFLRTLISDPAETFTVVEAEEDPCAVVELVDLWQPVLEERFALYHLDVPIENLPFFFGFVGWQHGFANASWDEDEVSLLGSFTVEESAIGEAVPALGEDDMDHVVPTSLCVNMSFRTVAAIADACAKLNLDRSDTTRHFVLRRNEAAFFAEHFPIAHRLSAELAVQPTPPPYIMFFLTG